MKRKKPLEEYYPLYPSKKQASQAQHHQHHSPSHSPASHPHLNVSPRSLLAGEDDEEQSYVNHNQNHNMSGAKYKTTSTTTTTTARAAAAADGISFYDEGSINDPLPREVYGVPSAPSTCETAPSRRGAAPTTTTAAAEGGGREETLLAPPASYYNQLHTSENEYSRKKDRNDHAQLQKVGPTQFILYEGDNAVDEAEAAEPPCKGARPFPAKYHRHIVDTQEVYNRRLRAAHGNSSGGGSVHLPDRDLVIETNPYYAPAGNRAARPGTQKSPGQASSGPQRIVARTERSEIIVIRNSHPSDKKKKKSSQRRKSPSTKRSGSRPSEDSSWYTSKEFSLLPSTEMSQHSMASLEHRPQQQQQRPRRDKEKGHNEVVSSKKRPSISVQSISKNFSGLAREEESPRGEAGEHEEEEEQETDYDEVCKKDNNDEEGDVLPSAHELFCDYLLVRSDHLQHQSDFLFEEAVRQIRRPRTFITPVVTRERSATPPPSKTSTVPSPKPHTVVSRSQVERELAAETAAAAAEKEKKKHNNTGTNVNSSSSKNNFFSQYPLYAASSTPTATTAAAKTLHKKASSGHLYADPSFYQNYVTEEELKQQQQQQQQQQSQQPQEKVEEKVHTKKEKRTSPPPSPTTSRATTTTTTASSSPPTVRDTSTAHRRLFTTAATTMTETVSPPRSRAERATSPLRSPSSGPGTPSAHTPAPAPPAAAAVHTSEGRRAANAQAKEGTQTQTDQAGGSHTNSTLSYASTSALRQTQAPAASRFAVPAVTLTHARPAPPTYEGSERETTAPAASSPSSPPSPPPPQQQQYSTPPSSIPSPPPREQQQPPLQQQKQSQTQTDGAHTPPPSITPVESPLSFSLGVGTDTDYSLAPPPLASPAFVPAGRSGTTTPLHQRPQWDSGNFSAGGSAHHHSSTNNNNNNNNNNTNISNTSFKESKHVQTPYNDAFPPLSEMADDEAQASADTTTNGAQSASASMERTSIIELHTARNYSRETIRRLRAYCTKLEDTRLDLKERAASHRASLDRDDGTYSNYSRASYYSSASVGAAAARQAPRSHFVSPYRDPEVDATLEDLDETPALDTVIQLTEDGANTVSRRVVERPASAASPPLRPPRASAAAMPSSRSSSIASDIPPTSMSGYGSYRSSVASRPLWPRAGRTAGLPSPPRDDVVAPVRPSATAAAAAAAESHITSLSTSTAPENSRVDRSLHEPPPQLQQQKAAASPPRMPSRMSSSFNDSLNSMPSIPHVRHPSADDKMELVAEGESADYFYEPRELSPSLVDPNIVNSRRTSFHRIHTGDTLHPQPQEGRAHLHTRMSPPPPRQDGKEEEEEEGGEEGVREDGSGGHREHSRWTALRPPVFPRREQSRDSCTDKDDGASAAAAVAQMDIDKEASLHNRSLLGSFFSDQARGRSDTPLQDAGAPPPPSAVADTVERKTKREAAEGVDDEEEDSAVPDGHMSATLPPARAATFLHHEDDAQLPEFSPLHPTESKTTTSASFLDSNEASLVSQLTPSQTPTPQRPTRPPTMLLSPEVNEVDYSHANKGTEGKSPTSSESLSSSMRSLYTVDSL